MFSLKSKFESMKPIHKIDFIVWRQSITATPIIQSGCQKKMLIFVYRTHTYH